MSLYGDLLSGGLGSSAGASSASGARAGPSAAAATASAAAAPSKASAWSTAAQASLIPSSLLRRRCGPPSAPSLLALAASRLPPSP